jgi:hypothetical protein
VVNGEEVKVTPIIANRLVDTYVLGAPLIDGMEDRRVGAWRLRPGIRSAKKSRARGRAGAREERTRKAGSTTATP